MIHVQSGEVADPLSALDLRAQLVVKDPVNEDYENEAPATREDKAAAEMHQTLTSYDDNDDDSIDGAGETQVDNFATYGQLVGPPSYEESVMYDRVMQAGAETEETVDNVQGPPLVVSIAEYQKQELPMMLGMSSGYIQYKVVTNTQLPSYKAQEVTVRRRFREFVSLSDILSARFRGYFLPPRPEKNAVEGQRMKEQFIEDRRMALEKYLNKLAAHPVVGSSDELRLFLEIESTLSSSLEWQMMQPPQVNFLEGTAKLSKQIFGKESSVPHPGEVSQPSTQSNDYLRRMKEGFQSMKQDMSGNASTDDERELRMKTKFVESQWDTLAETSRMAEKLVRRFEKMGSVFGDLGLSFIKLSKYEETEGTERAAYTETVDCAESVTAATKHTGIVLVRLARLARKVTGKMAQDLGELHDHLAFIPAILKAMSAREEALLTHQTLKSQHQARIRLAEDLETQAAQVVGGDRSKARRASDVRNDISTLEHSIEAADAQYSKIRKINFNEMDRYCTQKNKDFTTMLHSLACVQAAYADRSAEVWLQVAKELGATEEQVAEARNPPKKTGIRFD